jgi:hypothetical protein
MPFVSRASLCHLIVLSYVFRMEQSYSVMADVSELSFSWCLYFHMVVAHDTSLLMHAWQLSYMIFYGHKLCTLVVSSLYNALDTGHKL